MREYIAHRCFLSLDFTEFSKTFYMALLRLFFFSLRDSVAWVYEKSKCKFFWQVATKIYERIIFTY